MDIKKIILLFSMLSMLSCFIYAEDYVFIANMSVTEMYLSKDDISQIFTGKKVKWNDGSKIEVAVIKSSDIHNMFLKQYIDKTAAQFGTHWKKLVFSGKAIMPKFFESESELISYVSSTKGAIGYASSNLVDENLVTINIKE
ncbi:MAG: hypothetical protein ACD_79C00451G0002 [uncultured bacterium]|nr:MAG: hypothetical protein ACD_79C00451G0002 [uncultured bacterium]